MANPGLMFDVDADNRVEGRSVRRRNVGWKATSGGRFHRVAITALICCASTLSACGGGGEGTTTVPADEIGLTAQELLGKRIFFDTNLSEPRGQSCSSCHDPDKDFSGNNGGDFGVALGSRVGVSGTRNTPTLTYGSFAPSFHLEPDDAGDPQPIGGFFWDGRVNTMAEQAKKPFFNVREMNNPNTASLIAKISSGSYADLFRQVGGANAFDSPEQALETVAQALQAFQNTSRFHPFSSRYDAYIQGKGALTADELAGMALFKDPNKGSCAACHPMDDKSADPKDSLFTDYSYDSLGVPRNLRITDNQDPAFFDLGLCGPNRTAPNNDPSLCGAFKVPTLRNVAKKTAFFHNGFFNNLRDVVSFYVTRDTDPLRWYTDGKKFNDLPQQYQANVNTTEVPYNRNPGDAPALTEAEIDLVVKFLGTLSDR